MSDAALTLRYTPRPPADGRLPLLRLTLEPERVDVLQNRVTLADVDSMLMLARSGASARMRQIGRCRWARWDSNGDLLCTLALWVWPSDLALQYRLALPAGVTSAPQVLVREQRDTNIWIAGSGAEVELPWLIEGARISWHPRIGVWDGWSRAANPPAIRMEKARLTLDGEAAVYVVLWIRGEAVGYRHDITIRYPTGQNRDPEAPTISITNADDIEATATWIDETGEERTETATLVVPDCVKRLLERCPAGTAREGSIRVRPADPGNAPVTVYYNSCNGRVLGIRGGSR